jgi:hypothetical protein
MMGLYSGAGGISTVAAGNIYKSSCGGKQGKKSGKNRAHWPRNYTTQNDSDGKNTASSASWTAPIWHALLTWISGPNAIARGQAHVSGRKEEHLFCKPMGWEAFLAEHNVYLSLFYWPLFLSLSLRQLNPPSGMAITAG